GSRWSKPPSAMSSWGEGTPLGRLSWSVDSRAWLALDVTMPETSTAQRVGTSNERSQTRWAESLRPTVSPQRRGRAGGSRHPAEPLLDNQGVEVRAGVRHPSNANRTDPKPQEGWGRPSDQPPLCLAR